MIDSDILLDERLTENLKDLKEIAFEVLKNFNYSSKISKNEKLKNFNEIIEFKQYIMNQQEILNSEVWKSQLLSDFLKEIFSSNTGE